MTEEPKFKGLWSCPDSKIALNNRPPFQFKCEGMTLTDEGAELFEEALFKEHMRRSAEVN
jgi:hypothetical protein